MRLPSREIASGRWFGSSIRSPSGSAILKRIGELPASSFELPAPSFQLPASSSFIPARVATTDVRTMPAISAARCPERHCGTGTATDGAGGSISSSSSRASPMSRSRLRGSFSRQRRSSRRTDAASRRAAPPGRARSSAPTRACPRSSSPSNARRPVSISKRTTPNAQMSARRSTGLPARLLRRHVGGGAEDDRRAACACGRVSVGELVDASPASAGEVASGSSAFARPKSSTFTVPSARTLTFAGFRSRWTMPCSCAASSASAICRAIGSASSSGIGAARDALREVVALDELHHQRLGAPSVHPRGRRSARCSDD